MKYLFDVTFIFYNPQNQKQIEVPNSNNPVMAPSIKDVLELLSKQLPQPYGCECIGVIVKRVLNPE